MHTYNYFRRKFGIDLNKSNKYILRKFFVHSKSKTRLAILVTCLRVQIKISTPIVLGPINRDLPRGLKWATSALTSHSLFHTFNFITNSLQHFCAQTVLNYEMIISTLPSRGNVKIFCRLEYQNVHFILLESTRWSVGVGKWSTSKTFILSTMGRVYLFEKYQQWGRTSWDEVVWGRTRGLIERIGHAVSDTEWRCRAHIITPTL